MQDKNKATQYLLTLLVRNVFERCFSQPVSLAKPNKCDAVNVMTELVNIHLFGDFNGRTTRFMGLLASIELGEPALKAFLSDFDLLFPTELYQRHVLESSIKYVDLQRALLERMLAVVCVERRKASSRDYYHLNQWNGLVSTLEVCCMFSRHIPN